MSARSNAKRSAGSAGQIIIEFVIVLPIFVVLLFSLFYFGIRMREDAVLLGAMRAAIHALVVFPQAASLGLQCPDPPASQVDGTLPVTFMSGVPPFPIGISCTSYVNLRYQTAIDVAREYISRSGLKADHYCYYIASWSNGYTQVVLRVSKDSPRNLFTLLSSRTDKSDAIWLDGPKMGAGGYVAEPDFGVWQGSNRCGPW